MITALYASLLTLIYIYLSVLVIRTRQKRRIALGSGNTPELEQRIRAHANFMEYTPLALILLFLAEQQGLVYWALHLLAITFVMGRVLHLYGLAFFEKYNDNQLITSTRYRRNGMYCTLNMLAATAIINILLHVKIL
jgi:uncharacterized membrane protein YecN with MAPEG domain